MAYLPFNLTGWGTPGFSMRRKLGFGAELFVAGADSILT
ncbi:hypothetical protein D082_02690 [Synechocystis sp. PCC 6714]|nr:hypothetical protein D082_02690 [Synechocystis sp. PCC 6714]